MIIIFKFYKNDRKNFRFLLENEIIYEHRTDNNDIGDHCNSAWYLSERPYKSR